MRITTLNGSLRAGSANAVALDAASAALRAAGITTESVAGLDVLPAFDPDVVEDAPETVERFRSTLARSDGLLIAAPEYAAGVAGVVKNALDWLVGSATLHHKPVAVLSAGTTGGPFAIEHLVRTLSWQGALVVARCPIAAPRTKLNAAGTAFADAATRAAIEAWVATLTESVTASPARRVELVAEVVEEYGIDVARFGDLT